MISDLNVRLRERLEDWVLNCLDPQAAAVAVIAVLDRHRPEPFATYLGDDPPLYCLECAHAYSQEAWPCDTVKDVANALGVEL